jgi:hypothetical protein
LKYFRPVCVETLKNIWTRSAGSLKNILEHFAWNPLKIFGLIWLEASKIFQTRLSETL